MTTEELDSSAGKVSGSELASNGAGRIRRLARLQQITGALLAAAQQDVAHLARVIVDQAKDILGAQSATVVALDDDGQRFEVVATAGAIRTEQRFFPLDERTPFADALLSGQPVILETLAQRNARYPQFAGQPELGESWVALPLLSAGRPTGGIGFAFRKARRFDDEERDLLLLLADHCALALARGRLYEAQQAAHHELDRRYAEIKALYDLIDTAVRAGSIEEIYDQTLTSLQSAAGADRVALLLFDDAKVMRFVAWCGLSDEYRRAVEGHSPWAPDAVDPAAVLMPDALADERLSELHDVTRREGVRALAFIPLTYRGTLLGTCMLHYNERHDFTEQEFRVARIITNKTALAIQRKRAEQALAESERRYRGMVSSVPGVVWEAWGAPDAASQRIDFVNDYVEQLLGYTVGEWLSTPNFWLTIVHPDDREEVATRAAATFASGKPGQNHFRWIAKDGRVIWVDAYSTTICDDDGTQVGMRGVTIDVSERKQAEEGFSRAFQASPAAISITRGRDRVLLDVNDSFCEVFGYGREELIGRPVDDIGLWASDEERAKFTQAIADAGSLRNLEVAVRDRAGGVKLALGSAEVIEIAGEPCVIALFYDITERKLAEQRLAEAATRTQAILDTAVDGIITVDEAGVIESVNPAMCRLFGYEQKEVVGKNLQLFVPPQDDDEDDHKDIMGSGREMEGHRKDGTRFPMHVSVSEVALSGRRIFTGIVHDLTDRKRAEERLQFLAEASERLSTSLEYKKVLNELAKISIERICDWCAVTMLDDEGVLQSISVAHRDPERIRFVQELTRRYPPDSDAPRGAYEVLRTGRSEFYEAIPDEILVGLARDDEHLRLLRNLGICSAITVPLATRDRVIGTMTFATAESGRRYTRDDLTLAEELGRRAAMAVENAQLYAESQAIQDELRKASEAKDEFLGVISHELRTPITVVYGAARLLKSRNSSLDDEDRREVINDIEHESRRLRRLIEDMLVLARTELSRQQIELEPVHIKNTLSRIIREVGGQHASHQVKLTVAPGLPAVRADQTYIEQIMRNLLQNAIKYAPADEPIEIAVEPNGGNEALISVKDRGPGLKPDELAAVFERFYRSDRSRAVAGVGMGLTVCKRLVEAQLGRIWAELREGGGLAVNFTLPFYEEDAT